MVRRRVHAALLHRDDLLGTVTAGVGLLLLIVVVIIGSVTTNRAATRTQRAVAVNTAYQSTATAVAAERSLAHRYRLEPGPAPLAGHRAAGTDVARRLDEVERLGDAKDRTLVAEVRSLQAAYVIATARLFAAVDRSDPDATIAVIDDFQVDPIFSAMQEQITTDAASHLARATAAADSMRRTGRVVLALDAATLVAGMALVGLAGASLTRSRRRLRAQSDLATHQALHDSLTGLPNRALFHRHTVDAFEAAERTGEQVAVMLVDLNRFKDVNDTLGHHYGDVLLAQVARRFSSAVRTDDVVARLGGDEFAVLLSDTSARGALSAAQRLTDTLAEPFTVRDIALDVEAGIGIALVGAGSDVETAVRHADIAMYEAKRQHLPFATYELTRDDHTLARLAMLGDLRRAIAGRELVLHYQPKVSAVSGRLHGVEALVRWQDPTRGLLHPDAFVPIAETTAVIHALTAEVLRIALAQARTWLDRGWVVPVAVNISARSLVNPDFATEVARQLDAADVPASMLSLELTETAIMADPDRGLAVLTALDAMGISLSIDDFGTGYSSMSYLKNLPVRELKIDRSFVMGMATDDSDVVLVQSAVDLGHNLGLHVVAEGVEDASTQLTLAAMGCDLMQGYHIRRPVGPTDLEPWLATHAARTRGPAPRARAADRPAVDRPAVDRPAVGRPAAVASGACSNGVQLTAPTT